MIFTNEKFVYLMRQSYTAHLRMH